MAKMESRDQKNFRNEVLLQSEKGKIISKGGIRASLGIIQVQEQLPVAAEILK